MYIISYRNTTIYVHKILEKNKFSPKAIYKLPFLITCKKCEKTAPTTVSLFFCMALFLAVMYTTHNKYKIAMHINTQKSCVLTLSTHQKVSQTLLVFLLFFFGIHPLNSCGISGQITSLLFCLCVYLPNNESLCLDSQRIASSLTLSQKKVQVWVGQKIC